MLALAFSLGYFEALRRAIRSNRDPRHIELLFLIILGSAVVGSRLFHVVFEDPVYYYRNPSRIFAVWQGGYTFYGGLLIGILGVYAYCGARRISFLDTMDIITPSVMLGVFIGRIGCFLAGCCWGKPTDLPWGVVFSNPLSMASDHVHRLHPTQAYEALGGLALFVYCWTSANRRRFEGQVFFAGLIGYAVLRFFVEIFRGDDYRGFVLSGTLSYAQLISLTLLPFTVVALFLFSRLREPAK